MNRSLTLLLLIVGTATLAYIGHQFFGFYGAIGGLAVGVVAILTQR